MASVTVDVAADLGVLPRYEGMHAKIQRAKGPADHAALALLGTRTERMFHRPSVFCVAEGVYDWQRVNRFNLQDPTIDEMIARGVVPIVASEGVPAWNLPAGQNADHPSALPLSIAKHRTTVVAGLTHLKQRYPAVELVESYNEPDMTATFGTDESKAFVMWDLYFDAVAQVNALGLPGAPLRLGGPVLKQTDTARVGRWLDHCVAAGRPPGWVVWHTYAKAGSRPRAYQEDVEAIRQVVASKGFGDLPLWVTEWDLDTSTNKTVPSAAALCKTAASAMATYRFFVDAGIDGHCKFSQSDYNNLSRSMLVPQPLTSADPDPAAADGKVFPLFNVYRMLSMLPATRVAATDGLDAAGLGVGGLAARDDTSVAVVVWNWLGSTNTQAQPVSVTFTNLPSAWQGLTVQRFVVDATHSNWAFDHTADGLARLADVSGPVVDLGSVAANSVTLLVARPAGVATVSKMTLFEFSDGLVTLTVDVDDANNRITAVTVSNGSDLPCRVTYTRPSGDTLDRRFGPQTTQTRAMVTPIKLTNPNTDVASMEGRFAMIWPSD